MLMKVPDISQPKDSSTADPHVKENEVKEAIEVRHAEAAEEHRTAGVTEAFFSGLSSQ